MKALPPDPLFVLRCNDMGAVNSICFHNNDRLLAGTLTGNVYFWDLQTSRKLFSLKVGSNSITSLHHISGKLITQEKGGAIKYWSESNTGYVQEYATEANHLAFCRSTLLDNETHKMLFYPHEENSIMAVNLKNHDTEKTILTPSDDTPKLGMICCLKAIIIEGQIYVIAGYESGCFLTWDLRACKVINCAQFDENPVAKNFDEFSNKGIIGGSNDKLIAVSYQLETMDLHRTKEIQITNQGINCIRIRNDRKIFSTGGWDGRIRIFSWKKLKQLAVLTEHKAGGVSDIAYSNCKISMWNSEIMAAAGIDGRISLWNLFT